MYAILDYNPQLRPYAGEVERRVRRWRQVKAALLSGGGTLEPTCQRSPLLWHPPPQEGLGVPGGPRRPAAVAHGDFNGWDRTAHPMARMGNGIWELLLPGDDALWSGCKVQTLVQAKGQVTEHIPLYARRVVQDPVSFQWCAEVWAEEEAFPDSLPARPGGAPVSLRGPRGHGSGRGKGGQLPGICRPRPALIQASGYNAVQLMAVMEHPYYASLAIRCPTSSAPPADSAPPPT